ncbi:MAG: GNAT family N-acetyltransferase [Ilumatobacteraceae bacterium]|nr:GNAT family N-acetyltransferase [Ilumatobacteraceae bacterium]
MTLPPHFHIAIASTQDILPIRMKVLREGTPSQDPRYTEDDWEITTHLALYKDDEILGTSSWLTKTFPLPHASSNSLDTQLRGMAIDQSLQSTGLGAELLLYGIHFAQHKGAGIVWARARDSALKFYERNSFTTVGDAFIDEATGMSHHLVYFQCS